MKKLIESTIVSLFPTIIIFFLIMLGIQKLPAQVKGNIELISYESRGGNTYDVRLKISFTNEGDNRVTNLPWKMWWKSNHHNSWTQYGASLPDSRIVTIPPKQTVSKNYDVYFLPSLSDDKLMGFGMSIGRSFEVSTTLFRSLPLPVVKNNKNLLFYDRGVGHAETFRVNDDGTIGVFDISDLRYSGWRKSWDIIHPYKIGNNGYVLFYDRRNGQGEVYRINNDGRISSMVASYNSWRKSWDIIHPYKIGNNGYVLFYDRRNGQGEVYRINNDGRISSMVASYNSWRKSWDIIHPYKIGNNGYVLFYDRRNGQGEVYRINNDGKISAMVASYNAWRKSWDIIYPYKIGNNGYVLFYDRRNGQGEVYRINNDGKINAMVASYNAWRKSWDIIYPYKVGNNGHVLFYDRRNGQGEVYRINNDGKIGSYIASYNDWKKTWNTILQLPTKEKKQNNASSPKAKKHNSNSPKPTESKAVTARLHIKTATYESPTLTNVSGTVRNTTSEPSPLIVIIESDDGEYYNEYTIEGKSGIFTFKNLLNGKYRLTADFKGKLGDSFFTYSPAEEWITVKDGKVLEGKIELVVR